MESKEDLIGNLYEEKMEDMDVLCEEEISQESEFETIEEDIEINFNDVRCNDIN